MQTFREELPPEVAAEIAGSVYNFTETTRDYDRHLLSGKITFIQHQRLQQNFACKVLFIPNKELYDLFTDLAVRLAFVRSLFCTGPDVEYSDLKKHPELYLKSPEAILQELLENSASYGKVTPQLVLAGLAAEGYQFASKLTELARRDKPDISTDQLWQLIINPDELARLVAKYEKNPERQAKKIAEITADFNADLAIVSQFLQRMLSEGVVTADKVDLSGAVPTQEVGEPIEKASGFAVGFLGLVGAHILGAVFAYKWLLPWLEAKLSQRVGKPVVFSRGAAFLRGITAVGITTLMMFLFNLAGFAFPTSPLGIVLVDVILALSSIVAVLYPALQIMRKIWIAEEQSAEAVKTTIADIQNLVPDGGRVDVNSRLNKLANTIATATAK